jgi:hypothetical protein
VTKIWEVSESDLPGLFRQVEEGRADAVKRGIASAILLNAEVVSKSAPKDLGTLKQSARAVLQPGGGYVIVDAPHAGIVEMGSRPHFVAMKKLLPWCIRHSSPEEGPRFAAALQRKIAREGTKPTYFVRKTLPLQKKFLRAEVERELHAGE